MITTINEFRQVLENNTDWKETLDHLLAGGENPTATKIWNNLSPEKQEEYIQHYYEGQTDFSQSGNWIEGVAPTYDQVKADLLYLIELGDTVNEALSNEDKAQREWEKIRTKVDALYNKLKMQASACSIQFRETITVRAPYFNKATNEVKIYVNESRLYRHPDEYGSRGEKIVSSAKYNKFQDLLSKLDSFIDSKMRKFGTTITISA